MIITCIESSYNGAKHFFSYSFQVTDQPINHSLQVSSSLISLPFHSCPMSSHTPQHFHPLFTPKVPALSEVSFTRYPRFWASWLQPRCMKAGPYYALKKEAWGLWDSSKWSICRTDKHTKHIKTIPFLIISATSYGIVSGIVLLTKHCSSLKDKEWNKEMKGNEHPTLPHTHPLVVLIFHHTLRNMENDIQ